MSAPAAIETTGLTKHYGSRVAVDRRLLRRLADDGATVFVSSHQLSELEQICDHLVLLRGGRLIYQGSLSELLARQPANIVAVPDDPTRVPRLAELADEAGWSATVENGGVVVTAADADAGALNRLAHEQGIVLEELWRRPPTLEETFLALTAEASPEVSS